MSELAARIRAGEDRSRLDAILAAVGDDAGTSAEILSALTAALYDEHPGLRQAAMDTLARLTTERGLIVEAKVVERVVALAKDPSPRVRQEACVGLAVLRDDLEIPGRIAALEANLLDRVDYVRQEAAAARGDLGANSAKEALVAGLADPERGVRFEVAMALATLGDNRGRSVLELALDKNRTRLDACEGLRRLGDREAIPALEQASRRFFLPWVDRLTLLATLYHLGVVGAGSALLERTHARGREERAYAVALLGSHRVKEGLPRLRELAQASDPLRDTAVRALGELGDPAARPVLERLEADPSLSAELRADARWALARLAGERRDEEPSANPTPVAPSDSEEARG